MSYLTQNAIATNLAMHNRVAQCAATEGFTDPDGWATRNSRTWAASPGWDAAFESAMAAHPDDPEYDPGRDEAVVTDQMILSAVQVIGENPS
jgi:hypothetical protein